MIIMHISYYTAETLFEIWKFGDRFCFRHLCRLPAATPHGHVYVPVPVMEISTRIVDSLQRKSISVMRLLSTTTVVVGLELAPARNKSE